MRSASGPPSTSRAPAGPALRPPHGGLAGAAAPPRPPPGLHAPRRRTNAPPDLLRLLHRHRHRPAASPTSSWRDYLPRIVESIPRRVPNPDGASLTFPSAADAADAARRLFFPESLTDPGALTIPVLIFGALAVGVGVEVASLALRALPGGDDAAPEGGAAGGLSTADDDEDEAEVDGGGGGGGGGGGRADGRPPDSAVAGRVMGERYRGLAWLAGAAGLALYSAGLLTGSDKPLQP